MLTLLGSSSYARYILATVTALTSAYQARAQDSPKPVTETRVFDIRSLLLEVPDYRAIFSDLRSDDLYRPSAAARQDPFEPTPASPPAPGMDKPIPPDARKQAEKNAERIMELIRNIVDADTWTEHGGETGSMKFYAGQLVVRQTREAIVEIEQLLDLIRAARIRKVSLEAWFMIVPAKPAEQATLAPLLAGTQFSPGEFQQALDNKIVNLVRVSLSGFDGQRVYVSSGKQSNVVIGLQPVVDSTALGYQPQPRQLLSGVALEVQPVAEPERDRVLIDLRASLGKIEPPAGRPTKAEGGREFDLDTPPYQVAHFATSVSLPIGRVSRIGMTRYDENQDVLLFVQPSVE